MGWGAEGSAFAVTGALFLLCGAIASGPTVRARRLVAISMLVIAAFFITAAFLARSYGGWATTPWAWFATLLPLALLAFLGARATTGLATSHSYSRCSVPQRSARERAAAASEEAEAAASARLRRAADPHTSGSELADLAYGHPDVRLIVASNPATPANVLGWLATSGGEGIAEAIATRNSDGATSDAEATGQSGKRDA